MAKTNWLDRFEAWKSDPETPTEPTIQDAFREGFVQAFEFASGQLRDREDRTRCPVHKIRTQLNLNMLPICAVPGCKYGPQSASEGTHPWAD